MRRKRERGREEMRRSREEAMRERVSREKRRDEEKRRGRRRGGGGAGLRSSSHNEKLRNEVRAPTLSPLSTFYPSMWRGLGSLHRRPTALRKNKKKGVAGPPLGNPWTPRRGGK